MMANANKLSQNQIIRAVYSLRDLERASSALVFLKDDQLKHDNDRVHLRRHYCYETTAIVCYMRPFSSAHGEVRPLSLTEIGVDLTDEESALHDRLKILRNKEFAHSDFAKMEFKLDPIEIEETERQLYYPLLVVPEGPGLLSSDDINAMDSLVRKLVHGIGKVVFDYVQQSAEPLVISGGKIHRS